MLISALNALTSSPALCSVLINAARPAAADALHSRRDRSRPRQLCDDRQPPGSRCSIWPRSACWRRALLFTKTPQSFLPEEDQGAIFAVMRLPEDASINRTGAVVQQAENIISRIPGVQGVLSVVGFDFIDGITSPNQAFASILR
jgi:hydrophobic/amphiphilic exporter-1 (mainly G- bacteria), HAE1 family